MYIEDKTFLAEILEKTCVDPMDILLEFDKIEYGVVFYSGTFETLENDKYIINVRVNSRSNQYTFYNVETLNAFVDLDFSYSIYHINN